MNNLYWVGIRESEIKYTNFIKKSITIFGNKNISMQNKYKKVINHNNRENFDFIDKFYNEEMKKIVKENPNAKFMYYSQIDAYNSLVKNNLLKYCICFNNQKLVEFLSDKFKLKKYFKNIVPVLDYKLIKGKDINFNSLKTLFNYDEFVVQSHVGSGGESTILLNNKNLNEVKFNENEEYMVTKFQKNNIPLNANILVSDKEINIMPASIQIIENINNKLIFKGSDYISYRKIISDKNKKKLEKYLTIIAKEIKKMGYRGIFGVDMIYFRDEFYLMEINTRFQNSSSILNKALLENNLPSLQELQFNCFNNKSIITRKIDVNYSCYIKENNASNKHIPKEIEVLDKINKETIKESFCYEGAFVYNFPIYNLLIEISTNAC